MSTKSTSVLKSHLFSIFVIMSLLFQVIFTMPARAINAGSISGTVIASDGTTPISNITVCANGSGWDFRSCIQANSNEIYIITGLPAGEYKVEAFADGWAREYYWETWNWELATPIYVADSANKPDINFTLEPGGSISGQVFKDDGVTPISGIVIILYGPGGQIDTCTTGGNYNFNNVPFDIEWRVYAAAGENWCNGPETYAAEFWEEATNWDTATPVILTESDPTGGGSKDFTLDPGGIISGQVAALDVGGLSGITVCATGYNSDGPTGGCDVTVDGNYSINGLPFGDYRVEMWGNGWAWQYYENTLDWALAKPVSVIAGEPTAIVNFVAQPGGRISGIVRDANGGIIPNLEVRISSSWDSVETCTNGDGEYFFDSVPMNVEWRVQAAFEGPDPCDGPEIYFTEFWEEATNWDTATPVILTESDPTGGGSKDFTLESLWYAGSSVPLRLALASNVDLTVAPESAEQVMVASILNDPLFRDREGGGIEPATASGYSVSSDGLIYSVTLRSDALWSDNTPVTAQQFVDGFIYLLNPSTEFNYKFLLNAIHNAEAFSIGTITDPSQVGISALDAHTIQFTLDAPTAYFPSILSSFASFPIRKDVRATHPTDWANAVNYVGNGPYVMSEQTNSHILFERNPYYYGNNQTVFDQVAISIIPLETDRLAAYKRGDLNVLPNVSYPSISSDPELLADVELLAQPGTFVLGLTQRAPTNNINVRKALASALNRTLLLDAINNPNLLPATGVIPPETIGYQGAGVGYSYDPIQAQVYLAAAGYPNGDGFPELVLDISASNQPFAEAVAAQWRSVLNIPVRVQVVDITTLNNHYQGCIDGPSSCEINSYRIGWLLDYVDPNSILTDYFRSNFRAITALGWNNPAYNAKVDASITEMNPDLRLVLLQDAENILVNEDVAVIPLYHYNMTFLIEPGIYASNSPSFNIYLGRWGSTDTDEDGMHDLIDACPLDSSNTCNTSGSTAMVVKIAGGTVSTPSNDVTIEVPPNALTAQTTLTITDGGEGFVVNTSEGNVEAIVSKTIGPEGTSFEIPITIMLRWKDDNDDGVVDETTIIEDALILSKDGVLIAGPCNGDAANCNMVTNTFTVQVSSLSKFVIGNPITCYNLSLGHTGSGSTPTATPANSDACSPGKYVEGESIALSGAIPSTGWQVNSWIGTNNDASTATVNTISMPSQDHTVSVAFEQIEYSLTVTSVRGTITKNPSQSSYHYGDIVELTAKSDSGWLFVDWAGDISGSRNPISITIDENKNIIANYAKFPVAYLLPTSWVLPLTTIYQVSAKS